MAAETDNFRRAIGSNTPLTDSLTFDLGGNYDAFGADLVQNLRWGVQSSHPIDFRLDFFLSGSMVGSVTGSVAPMEVPSWDTRAPCSTRFM